MEDLARSLPSEGSACHLYLVAPNSREREVIAQLARPAFKGDLRDLSLAFIPFRELRDHCEAMCKVGENHQVLRKIARCHAKV